MISLSFVQIKLIQETSERIFLSESAVISWIISSNTESEERSRLEISNLLILCKTSDLLLVQNKKDLQKERQKIFDGWKMVFRKKIFLVQKNIFRQVFFCRN